MKKLCVFLLTLVVALSLASCGASNNNSSANTSEKSPPDLAGEWKQTNSDSEDSYQAATISDDVITVNWVSDGGKTTSIYWVGTYVAPTTADEPYSWDSENDHSQTDSALLASSDDTKTFAYQDGVLSYQVSALGTTTTIELEKAD